MKKSLSFTLIFYIFFLFCSFGCTVEPNDSSPDKGGHEQIVEIRLPRATSSKVVKNAMSNFETSIQNKKINLHGVMIVKGGKVIGEKYWGIGPTTPHVLWSISKTFTAFAVGYACEEGKLNIEDQVISFFPDLLPATVSENLKEMKVKHLLTMTCGHDRDFTNGIAFNADYSKSNNWVKDFLSRDVDQKPGTYFLYNTIGSYMLSAIVQKVIGERVVDYLYPRLFQPLGINKPSWVTSPQGIDAGGWGLYLSTENLAKCALLFLNDGKYEGQQIISSSWLKEMSSLKGPSIKGPIEGNPEDWRPHSKSNDWGQGYGYQMWRCSHNAFRAEGIKGQFVVVIPEFDAIVITTGQVDVKYGVYNLLNAVWNDIYPILK